MTTREFGEWLAYSAYDPFGNERGDLRAAMQMCLLANINRDIKRHPQPYKTDEFMLRFKEDEPAAQSQAEQMRLVKIMNEALGGKETGTREHNDR